MFELEYLSFFLPASFKGLSKEYIIKCIFDEEIQNNWNPGTGDVIVGPTGNVFVISNTEFLHETLGGIRYYYGGFSCNRNGGNILNETACYTANESGVYYDPIKGETPNLDHSSIRQFRYVPYPHELKNNT